MEGTIGEIRLFAGNFNPRSWAFCQGQLLSISQNTALFAIIGTIYGGNGQTTFALPDLRGRVAISPGQGPGLPNYAQGQMAGEWNVTLIGTQMPGHNHTLNANNAGFASAANPNGAVLSIGQVPSNSEAVNMYTAAGANTTLSPTSIGQAGGNQPHNNVQPYLGLNYIICIEGIFPSRN